MWLMLAHSSLSAECFLLVSLKEWDFYYFKDQGTAFTISLTLLLSFIFLFFIKREFHAGLAPRALMFIFREPCRSKISWRIPKPNLEPQGLNCSDRDMLQVQGFAGID